MTRGSRVRFNGRARTGSLPVRKIFRTKVAQPSELRLFNPNAVAWNPAYPCGKPQEKEKTKARTIQWIPERLLHSEDPAASAAGWLNGIQIAQGSLEIRNALWTAPLPGESIQSESNGGNAASGKQQEISKPGRETAGSGENSTSQVYGSQQPIQGIEIPNRRPLYHANFGGWARTSFTEAASSASSADLSAFAGFVEKLTPSLNVAGPPSGTPVQSMSGTVGHSPAADASGSLQSSSQPNSGGEVLQVPSGSRAPLASKPADELFGATTGLREAPDARQGMEIATILSPSQETKESPEPAGRSLIAANQAVSDQAEGIRSPGPNLKGLVEHTILSNQSVATDGNVRAAGIDSRVRNNSGMPEASSGSIDPSRTNQPESNPEATVTMKQAGNAGGVGASVPTSTVAGSGRATSEEYNLRESLDDSEEFTRFFRPLRSAGHASAEGSSLPLQRTANVSKNVDSMPGREASVFSSRFPASQSAASRGEISSTGNMSSEPSLIGLNNSSSMNDSKSEIPLPSNLRPVAEIRKATILAAADSATESSGGGNASDLNAPDEKLQVSKSSPQISVQRGPTDATGVNTGSILTQGRVATGNQADSIPLAHGTKGRMATGTANDQPGLNPPAEASERAAAYPQRFSSIFDASAVAESDLPVPDSSLGDSAGRIESSANRAQSTKSSDSPMQLFTPGDATAVPVNPPTAAGKFVPMSQAQDSDAVNRTVDFEQKAAASLRQVEPRNGISIAPALNAGPVPDSQKAAAAVPNRTQEFMTELSGRIRSQVHAGDSLIRIQIRPDYLGYLEIHAKNGIEGLTARISTESGAVKSLLENNLSMLQQSLQDQGFKVERIEIVVHDALGRGMTFSQQHTSGHSEHGHSGQSSSSPSGSFSGSASAAAEQESAELGTRPAVGPNSTFHTIA